jgi:photosynthetic reaction center cytochrome c subunit
MKITSSELSMKSFVLRVLVFALTCASAVIVIDKVGAQAVSPAQQDKPTEQVQKNIKVLNGLPQWQLIPVMNYFSASLGRRCNFCHVNNQGQWDYASDAKPEKNQAREMIKLVLDTNKNYFKGNLEVSCYTCHRGANHPASVTTLPLPVPSPAPAGAGPGASGPGAQPQASPSPRPSPPAPEAIISKYIDAIGGQAAIDKIKSRVTKGTITSANGNTGTFETMQTLDKGYEVFVTQRGTLERAVSTNAGWEKSSQGVRDVLGHQLTDMQVAMQLFRNLKLKEQYESLRFAGRDKIGDRDVVIVVGTTAEKKRERLFFDAENGLLLRRISYLETIVGLIPDQIDFEDYREVDGVKLPFTVRTSPMDPGNPFSVRKFTEIKLNVGIDESKFNKPAAATP